MELLLPPAPNGAPWLSAIKEHLSATNWRISANICARANVNYPPGEAGLRAQATRAGMENVRRRSRRERALPGGARAPVSGDEAQATHSASWDAQPVERPERRTAGACRPHAAGAAVLDDTRRPWRAHRGPREGQGNTGRAARGMHREARQNDAGCRPAWSTGGSFAPIPAPLRRGPQAHHLVLSVFGLFFFAPLFLSRPFVTSPVLEVRDLIFCTTGTVESREMRQYNKQLPGGLLLLLDWTGSALPRALPFAIVAAVYGCLIERYYDEEAAELFVHTYPYHVLAFVTGAAVRRPAARVARSHAGTAGGVSLHPAAARATPHAHRVARRRPRCQATASSSASTSPCSASGRCVERVAACCALCASACSSCFLSCARASGRQARSQHARAHMG